MSFTNKDLERKVDRVLAKLDAICCSSSATTISNYQPLDCNGDPIGTPISASAVISVAKQDVSVCNYQQLANAIAGLYNVPNLLYCTDSTTVSLSGSSIDVTKLHSISIVITGTTGTVSMTGTLGGGAQTHAALPVGFSTNFDASTVFGTGDLSVTTTAGAQVIISLISKA